METNAPTILRLTGVISRTSLSRSTIYAWIKTGDFPSPIHLGPRAVGWLLSEVDAWLERRVVDSRSQCSTRLPSE